MLNGSLMKTCTLAAAILASLLFAELSYGRGGVPRRDPRDGVLDSSVIVIVQRQEGDSFRINEVLLGKTEAGEFINLPNFKLLKNIPGGWRMVAQEQPLTQQTRILLFLERQEHRPKPSAIACRGNCYFWVDDPAKTPELVKMARGAIKLRDDWEKAKAIADATQRVEALWPYLWTCGSSFARQTRAAMEEMGAAAGDYFAQRVETMDHNQRMTLMRDAPSYNSEKFHDAILELLKQQKSRYEAILKERGAGSEKLIEDWGHAPQEIKDIWGELYYGLVGLAKFKNRRDLPFIRELARWAIQYRFIQTCDAALGAFRQMPEKENIAIIESIWHEFSTKPLRGIPLLPYDVTRALRTHRFPETVPVLVQFLGNKKASGEARAFLTKLVGEDLGPEPAAWLQWYKANSSQQK